MQTVLNIIDHGMTLQEALEAPCVFTQGQEAEIEKGFSEPVRAELAAFGRTVAPVDHVAGGLCAIGFLPEGDRAGEMTGAACWQADGTSLGIGGGLARKGTSFFTDPRGIAARAVTANKGAD